MSERRFDEREVARILDGAATQERALVRARDAAGLTLPELERIALEAGLDPAHVRRAAHELDVPRDARAIVVERTLPEGRRPDAVALVARVRAAAGERSTGSASDADGVLAWRGQVDGAQTDVTVTPVGGRHVVRVHLRTDAASQTAHARWLVGAGGGAALALLLALLGTLGALALVPALAALLAGWLLARRDLARRVGRLSAIANAIAEEVGRSR